MQDTCSLLAQFGSTELQIRLSKLTLTPSGGAKSPETGTGLRQSLERRVRADSEKR